MQIDNIYTYKFAYGFEPLGEPRVAPAGPTVSMVSNGAGLFGVVVQSNDITKLLLTTDSQEYAFDHFNAVSLMES